MIEQQDSIDIDVVLVDDFKGDDQHLIRSARALIALNDSGALTPHGVGGMARGILAALTLRMERNLKGDVESDMPIGSRWPSSGQEVGNAWFHNFAGFSRLLQEHPGFWSADFGLKYLGVRLDTRSGGRFTLCDRDGRHIHPDRVLRAIETYQRATITIVPVGDTFQVDVAYARR